ncbi:hypothetical protein [Rhizobium rhizogenes]|jgi:hypothetical protein|uniref:hypothetical protein n=1 Tax=Rhizobium rhizogenes TaxID=359 RepID=UPI0006459B85|nr:hypothetical protein [Rhizobium rhizogenes]
MSRPKPVLSIPLMAKKVPALVGHLDYQRVELSNKQKRLAGRYTLRPEIDLGRFTTRAVIDWLAIGVLLEKPTQFQWIQREIEGLLGRTPFVENIFGGRNDSSVGFDVRFQEPDIPTVLEAVAAIDAKFGLGMEPIVRSIEISVDFTPRVPSDLERARIVRVLTNHILVEPDVISNIRSRPRTVWGRGEDKVMRLLYDSGLLTPEENKQFLIATDRDRAPFTDGTFELGAREAEARWRVMDKIVDQQNVQAGTFLALDDKSKRARIEVTIDRPEVAALGVTFLSDLKKLNFTRLQGRYFQFFLPTFSRQAELNPGVRSAITVWRDRQRTLKFIKTGNVGLKAMDEALAEQRIELKRQALPGIHKRGLRLPNVDRIATGAAGSFAAYDEMNDRVRVSLRNLGKRVAAGFGSVD